MSPVVKLPDSISKESAAEPSFSQQLQPHDQSQLSGPAVAAKVTSPENASNKGTIEHTNDGLGDTPPAPPLRMVEDNISDHHFEPRTIKSRDGLDHELRYFEYTGPKLELYGTEDRPHRLIKLSNRMEVLIAQDSDQNNAAAAMHVKVGFMSDPIDFPGIAHFCEHMLFLGTKKYPTVGEFDKFLAANNGMSNAYTTMNATCFYFSVANQGFYEALDRFAQFFVMPLFNADYVQREVKAVDSEHKKNLENDPYRVFRLYCHSACPAHPLHKFNCGNYDTLMGNAEAMGVSLRDQLLDFYSRYYSSDIMKLSIVASQPLDTLTEWVASMFYPVVSKGQTVPIPSTIPFGPDEVAVAFRFKTVRKMYWTWITFPIPESKHLYKSHPLAYIDSLFEYHGEGSLFAYLDKRGWISDISGSPDNDVEGFDVYRCQLALTEEGHRHHRDVLRALFSYLNMFRSHPLPHSYFDDVRQHRRDRFQFKVLRRSASFVTNAVRLLSSPHYPRQHLYAAKDLLLDYSPELIQRTLEFLRPDNCVMLIGSDDPDVAYNKKEKYFGIEYRRDPIDPEFLEELRNIEPFPEFKLPPKNPYMVKGLKPITGIEKAKNPVLEPTLLLRSNLGEVWHRKDDRFFLPRGEINLKMTLPHICDSAKSDVAFDLLVNILNKELKLLTSQFSLAGLGYELLAYYDSMKLDVYGFTPKLLLAYSTVLEFIRNYAPTRERFESEKTDLLKDLCNFVHEQPDSHAVAFNKYLLCSKAAYIDDCVEELKATDYDQFTQFVADVFSEAYFKVMAVGYFDEDTALRAYRLAVDLFNPQPAISIERRHPIRANRQKPGRYILQRTSMSSDNLNSAVCHTVYFGNLSVIEHNVYAQLICSLAHSWVYTQLRTNETLGYIVYCCRVISYTSAIGLRFMVKGEGNPAYVQLRLDNFYREFRTNKLAKMTQEELNQQIEALITQNEKPDYDVFSESDRYWEWIDRGLYRFYDKMEENKVLRNATKEKLVEFWDEHLDPLCPEHGSLIVHIYSAKITTPSLQDRATYRDVVIALKGCLERDGVTGLSYADVHEIVSTVVASNKSIKGGDAINEFKRLVVSKVPGVDQDALAKAFGSEEAYSRIALNMAVSDYTNNVTTEHSAAVVAAAPAAAPTTTTLPVDAIIIYCTPTGDHVFSDIRKYREGLEVSGLLPYSHPLTPKYP